MAATSVAAFCVLAPLGACSSDDSGDAPPASGVLDQVAPTKADIAKEAGIVFPASTQDFRLVRISGAQIDVTFTVTAADVAAFADGSGISLTDGKRTIVHASPLWNVAVQGPISGGQSTKDGVDRAAEVVPDGDRATVRLTVTPKS